MRWIHCFSNCAYNTIEEGLFRLKTVLVESKTSQELWNFIDCIRFDSEQIFVVEKIIARFRDCFQLVLKNLRSRQWFFLLLVMRWRVFLPKQVIFKINLAVFLLVFSLIFRSRAVALMDHLWYILLLFLTKKSVVIYIEHKFRHLWIL